MRFGRVVEEEEGLRCKTPTRSTLGCDDGMHSSVAAVSDILSHVDKVVGDVGGRLMRRRHAQEASGYYGIRQR